MKVVPDKLANDERENLRVRLDTQGDMYSWFQVLPRFRIDRVGDRIQSNNEIFLAVAERSKEFLHCAERQPKAGSLREINCSLESTSWKLTIFQSAIDSPDPSLLLASQLVSISDPETKSFLTVATRESAAIKLLSELDDGNEAEAEGGADATADKNEEKAEGEEGGEEEEGEFFHQYGDLVVKPSPNGEIASSSLWFVESKKLVVGGPIQWKTEQVRFRHLNSAMYLLQDVVETFDEETGMVDEVVVYCMTDNPTLPGTLFQISEINSTKNLLSNGRASQISQHGTWIERGEILDDMSFAIKGSRNRDNAVALVISRYIEPSTSDGPGTEGDEDDSSRPSAIPCALDCYVGVSARDYLRKYLDMTVVEPHHHHGDHGSNNTIWPAGDLDSFDFFSKIIERCQNFVHGFSINDTGINLEVDKGNLTLQNRRQNLFREQGIIEIILLMIHKLVPISVMAEEAENAKNKKSSTSSLVDEPVDHHHEANSMLIAIGQDVLKLCFQLVLSCMQGNPENEIYVADFMPVLLAHLSTQPLAAKCVTSMLSNNMELQETKIGKREINIFIKKLRGSKMNAMYMQLLQAVCSCQGDGVDGNQTKVAEQLLAAEECQDILIKVVVNNSDLYSVPWNRENSLFIAPGMRPIRGSGLMTDGLPRILLTWNMSNARDLSPYILFGKQEVDIETLFRVQPLNGTLMPSLSISSFSSASSSSSKNSSRRKSVATPSKAAASDEKKKLVADYFVSQMFLGAEACMDRNYVAMHACDDSFPYEVLISMLKADVKTTLKSAAMRMILFLHVDRDPQAGMKIPRQTRPWSFIEKHDTPVLPSVEPEREFTFGLLQQYIFEHIRGMAGTNWDELSRHTLKTLRYLVAFNFYGSNDKLKSVIFPLIQAIDRRQVVYEDKSSALVKSSRTKKSNKEKRKPKPQKQGSYSKVSPTDETSDMSTNSYSFEEEGKKVPWQRPALEFMESIPTLCAVLLLVVIAVTVTLYQFVTGEDDSPGTPLYAFGIAVLLVFCIEVIFRGYCYCMVRGTFLSFISQLFNQIDVLVISIDIIFLCLPSSVTSAKGSSFTKILRLIRLARLLRVLKAGRLMSKLNSLGGDRASKWKLPARYSKAPAFEIQTMVDAVDVLLYAQGIIEDRNISILLRYFYLWYKGDSRTPGQLFEQAMLDSKELSLQGENPYKNKSDKDDEGKGGKDKDGEGGSSENEFDLIILDVLMFQSTSLTQSGLEILMANHSSRRRLLDNAGKVQLMISSKREKQFEMVQRMLATLEQNAETHELWGELETPEHHKQNEETKAILNELSEMCKTRRFVLEINEDFTVDVEIQNLYRNLGCFDICFKLLGLLESVDDHTDEETGEIDEIGKNTIEIVILCTNLLYWFFLENPDNQELGFGELSFFMENLDANINCHVVLRAIFKNNVKLMKMVDRTLLQDLSDRIAKEGKNPHYLALFACITNSGDLNIPENQFEIMKALTSPGRLEKVALYFCGVDHPDYEEKREAMKPFAGRDDINIHELPPLLAYHLCFVEVMACCTVGRLNITTVEAKVQSVYNYSDVIESILDPDTILLAKIRMGQYFFNAIIEVEMRIPGLEHTSVIWKLLESFVPVLQYAKDQIRLVEKVGWESERVSRQRIEYIMICCMIVGGFFGRYYDPSKFRLDDGSGSEGRCHLTQPQINDLIYVLFNYIKDIYDIDSPRLSQVHKAYLYQAVINLNRSGSRVFVSKIESTHDKTYGEEVELDVTLEGTVSRKYKEFLQLLKEDEEVQYKATNENLEFVKVLESLPYISDPVISDLRYEALIRKMVAHTRDNLSLVNNERRLNSRCIKTTAYLIKSFRLMIENKMGMSIYVRDDEGGEEQDIAAEPVVRALNTCGATALCLDLIAVGMDEEVCLEAIKLGVGLLFKEGGAKDVQALMHKHLSTTDSSYFFRQLKASIQKLIAWHNWNGITKLEEGQDPDLPEIILVIRFMQLMCEGHFLPNQDLLREQPHNRQSINLLDDYAAYLNCLSRLPCRTSTIAGIRIEATILEVIQGPCPGNQAHFALNTELLETLNRVMRLKPLKNSDCVHLEEIELKSIGIDIFQGLLEGQGAKSVVYERVLSVLHIDIIQMLASPGMGEDEEKKEEATEVVESNLDDVTFDLTKKPEGPELTEEEVVLQAECMVLLQMLCDFKEGLREELGISSEASEGSASIEIFWRGTLHRRFFHIPNICYDLGKSSKNRLVEEVDRSNLENQLADFIERSSHLYREVKHQQVLKSLGIALVFNPFVQDYATWASFFCAITINLLYLGYYVRDSSDPEGTPIMKDSFLGTNVVVAVNVLNIVQAITASFVLLQHFVITVPVLYEDNIEEGQHPIVAAINTIPGYTLYYSWYLAFSICGILIADYFIVFLLLDIIVKNSTTQNVLKAVTIPFKALSMAFLLGIFVMWIFTYYLFFFFANSPTMSNNYPGVCDTMLLCAQEVLVYGLRAGGGIGDYMMHSTGSQAWFDLAFFLAVTIVLLNIIFGITVDTFGELRDQKDERIEKTENFCFICSLHKQTFDRECQDSGGFDGHIRQDHNMWNYLYYIFFLHEQDRDDDDGLEQYVRLCIEANDISWFPMNKAMRLNQADSASSIMKDEVLDTIKARVNKLSSKLNAVQQDVNLILGNFREAITQENEGGASAKEAIARHLFNLAQHSITRRGFEEEEEVVDEAASNGKDDGSVDEKSVVYMGKHVFIRIMEIVMPGTPDAELSSTSCRVLCESGMYSINQKESGQGRVVFDSDECVVCENAMPGDPRSCRIQILQGNPAATMGLFVAKFIATIELEIDDIIAACINPDGVWEKLFHKQGQETGASYILKLVCTCEDAKTYGLQGEGDEWNSDEDD